MEVPSSSLSLPAALVAVFALVVGPAARGGEGDAPEVVRVRIPSGQVASQFPPDTPLRVLSPTDFDALLGAVEARGRDRERGGPRLVRARHFARFSSGLLVGRSELVAATPPGSASVSIEPWSPAILKGPESGAAVASSATGESFLRLETPSAAKPGEATFVLEWELRARPDSRGRIFSLSLPGDETTSLTLDVPVGWEPSGAAVRREGPSPGEAPDRETWRFHGRVGALDLRLTNLAETRAAGNPSRIWVGGPTRIDLNAVDRLATRPVNWTTDWTIQADEPGGGTFTVELDPGLDLLGVEGPTVREFRVEEGTPRRAVVWMATPGGEAVPVRFRGHARVPAEGAWDVPAIRPLPPLTWTGGTTTILLDERHVVRECRERDGRRVPPPPGETAGVGGTVLVFESAAPGSAAELTFRAAGNEPVYTLRGRLALRPSSIRLECEVAGLGLPGSAPEHELELPAGWAVDRVELAGVEGAPPWSRTVRPDGSTLLRVLAPASDAAPSGRTLLVGAVAAGPVDAPKRLMLPRVRPTRGRVADEAWVATAAGRIQLQPGETRGLDWIDPVQTPGLLQAASPETADLKPVLAWRWTADDAEAPVDVLRVDPSSRGWVHVKARLEERGRKLAVSGWITIATAGGGDPAARVWINARAGDLGAWTFTDAADGNRLAPTILAESDRRRLGFPDGGVVLELAAETSAQGRATVRFASSTAWDGRGTVPLPCLPGADSPRGVVVIETPEHVRSRITGEGLSRIEASLAETLAPGPDAAGAARAGGPSPPAGWTSQAMTYSTPGSRLDLATEELTPARARGLIRDARLTTRAFPDGRSLNRLWTLVAADQTDALTFQAPAGSVLVSARVDGRAVDPTRVGDEVSIPLPSGPGEPTRAVELDYRLEPSVAPSGGRLRPTAPDFGLPCLSFSWELILSPGLTLDEAGPGFVVDSTEPRPPWPFGSLGVARWRWPGERAAMRLPREDVLRRLDESLGEAPTEDLTLAEAFIRWDAGAEPLIVDRSALAAEGFGPRSRYTPAPTPVDAAGGPKSLAALQSRGLVLLLVDDALLVTSRRAAGPLSGSATWRSAVAEAILWGADATDRFQSSTRWRGESTPIDSTPTNSAPADRRGRASGWSTSRLTASSWPGPDAWVETADAGTRALLGWVAALAVIAVGLRRAVSPRRGLIAPLLLMIASVVLHDWWEAAPPPVSAGAFVGAFITLLVRLGRLLRETLRGRGAPGSGRVGRTSARFRRGFRVAAWVLATIGLSRASAFQPPVESPPILALFPYDGAFDPAAAPSRVILRQADHERLARAGEAPAPKAEERASILAAEHRVARGGELDLAVESDYSVRVGDGPATAFEFPVGGARDLVAALDDVRAPVIVRPGGEVAVVMIPGGRTSRLRVRRTASPFRDGSLETLDLKVNRAPFARLTLEQPPGGRPVQQLVARGRVIAKGDQTIEAVLGPVDRIGISWTSPNPDLDQPSATVESLMLWDLDPAGERVRARLTYRTRRRTSTIRIALEPGLIPRSVQIPGLVDASWGGTPQNPEWVARVDPPLPDRTTIFLDFWRPLRGEGGTEAPGPVARRFPRVEPMGVERESGLLAVRRPGHWTGRLEPPRDAEPVGDESFVRAWGALPDDVLTFAGTVRFKPQDVVEFRTGPTPTRWRLKPSVQLQVDAGRVDCRYEIEHSEITGLLDRVGVALPDELILLDVESAGMTDWSRPSGGPLQVRFDRIDLKSRRTIKVRGWIPVARLEPGPGPRQHRLRLPWPDAAEGRGSAGTLEVLSRGVVDLATAPGGAAFVTSEPTEPGGAWTRQSYRIDDPTQVGELRWTPQPPRPNVLVGSQLTIHPDSAEWIAVLRYEVAGGPLDAIHLKVPAAWAPHARLRLTGQEHQLTTESRDGWTFWTITPERPIWGSQRVVLRSRAPIAAGQEVGFPKVVPLGLGVVDTAVALVFATATVPTTAGSAGLRQISHASRFQDEEFGAATGLAARAYHVDVDVDRWSLDVQTPTGDDAGLGGGDVTARVRDAELLCVLAPDGGATGTATYRTEPRSGPFLTVAPPEAGRLLRAAVDGAAVRPLLDAESRWVIPLGDQAARSVTLTWAAEGAGAGAEIQGRRDLGLPRVGDGRTPTLVVLHLPADEAIDASSLGLEAVGPERQQLERADRVARQVVDLIAEMDRGSGRDRGRLVSLLIEHESALRGAERALLAASRSADRGRRDRAARDLDVIKGSRLQLVEALHSTGLEEPVADALTYLGLQAEGASPAATGIAVQAERERMRRLGRPRFFVGSAPGLDDPPIHLPIETDRAAGYVGVSESRARSLLLLALLMGLGLAGLTSARQVGAQSLIAAASLSLAAVAGGRWLFGPAAWPWRSDG
ncbi:hypothetical protein [Planctomyces sp. SH-PL62]|uniref:hypothetical protein n=1 Tax=Planctomyces sp. SH-PL62 TaxID=1636152 RepID=UPI00078E5A67|nr:hypothetical protein [Planctomyces sp. SH-PL62]AMV37126.1 hypothetical protein VT85_06820 [Planctomyces sp. SH-PL62]